MVRQSKVRLFRPCIAHHGSESTVDDIPAGFQPKAAHLIQDWPGIHLAPLNQRQQGASSQSSGGYTGETVERSHGAALDAQRAVFGALSSPDRIRPRLGSYHRPALRSSA